MEPPKPAPKEKPVEASVNFTMAGWIHPDNDIVMPKESHEGTGALFVERNDMVYPAPGHEVWTARDAGAGIGVGANGVCVYEHSDGYFIAPLVHPVPITGWTHVAVVYQDNTPSLWINGKMVRKAMKSTMTVHGSIGVVHKRQVTPYQGQIKNLIQLPKALSEGEILALTVAVPDTSAIVTEEPVQSMDLVGREIDRNGSYQITTADGKTRQIEVTDIPEKMILEGSWELTFTKGGGAPDQITFDKLISWSRHSDIGIKHYSGSAMYKKTFNYQPVNSSSGLKPVVYLDLGKVAVMAEVVLNGKNLGLLWNPPFKVDVTGCIKEGENQLEIRVVNLMVNRMIGDEELPDDSDRNEDGTLKSWPQWLLDGKPSPTGRFTFTSWRLWPKDSPLQTSGLLGPVTVQTAMQF